MCSWRLLPYLQKLSRKELERARRLFGMDAMAHGLGDVLREAVSMGSVDGLGHWGLCYSAFWLRSMRTLQDHFSFPVEISKISSISLAINFRQIPYAIGQFTVNEFCHELVLWSVTEETKLTISKNNSLRYGIQLGSGIIAGLAAAILSYNKVDQLYNCIRDPDY